MIDAPNVEYRIFVLCVLKKDHLLKPGTDVLHQVLALLLVNAIMHDQSFSTLAMGCRFAVIT